MQHRYAVNALANGINNVLVLISPGQSTWDSAVTLAEEALDSYMTDNDLYEEIDGEIKSRIGKETE